MVLIPIEQYERLLKRKHTEAQSGAGKSARAAAAAAARYSRKTKNRQVDSIEILI